MAKDDDPPPSLLQLTPLNPDFAARQHEIFARLRADHPTLDDALTNAIVLSRFADVRATLNDRTMLRGPDKASGQSPTTQNLLDNQIVDPETGEKRFYTILFMDEPDHSRVRAPLAKALYARAAKSKPLIAAIVAEKLETAAAKGRFDLMADFAIPIPIDVIGAILGVDVERRAEFRDWSEGVIQSLNPLRTPAQSEHMLAARTAISGYIEELMAARRAKPEDDLVTDMVRLKSEGAALQDMEIVINLIGLLVGGNLTTTDLIGNGVYALLTHPDELAKLRAEPGLINQAVEEILRYDGPVDITARVTSEAREIGGCPVAGRRTVVSLLRAANRDPEAFAEPERFDIARKAGPSVAFGGGAHICIGAPLARLEAQAAIGALFARFPDLRLAEPGAPPKRRKLPFFNGFERLEVVGAA